MLALIGIYVKGQCLSALMCILVKGQCFLALIDVLVKTHYVGKSSIKSSWPFIKLLHVTIHRLYKLNNISILGLNIGLL